MYLLHSITTPNPVKSLRNHIQAHAPTSQIQNPRLSPPLAPTYSHALMRGKRSARFLAHISVIPAAAAAARSAECLGPGVPAYIPDEPPQPRSIRNACNYARGPRGGGVCQPRAPCRGRCSTEKRPTEIRLGPRGSPLLQRRFLLSRVMMLHSEPDGCWRYNLCGVWEVGIFFAAAAGAGWPRRSGRCVSGLVVTG